MVGVKRSDEVITPPNSFISSTSVIAHIGATPVFVDVLQDQNINHDSKDKDKEFLEGINPQTKYKNH